VFAVERLQAYTPEDAAGIGRLRPILSEGKSDDPVPEQHLRAIIESPTSEQFVARLDDSRRIIGAATLTILFGALSERKAWLNDFVTDPAASVRGIGRALWQEMGQWRIENDVDMTFTSHHGRTAAHNFYQKQGAEIRDTTVFVKHFRTSE